jgi:hypothetical protein
LGVASCEVVSSGDSASPVVPDSRMLCVAPSGLRPSGDTVDPSRPSVASLGDDGLADPQPTSPTTNAIQVMFFIASLRRGAAPLGFPMLDLPAERVNE